MVADRKLTGPAILYAAFAANRLSENKKALAINFEKTSPVMNALNQLFPGQVYPLHRIWDYLRSMVADMAVRTSA